MLAECLARSLSRPPPGRPGEQRPVELHCQPSPALQDRWLLALGSRISGVAHASDLDGADLVQPPPPRPQPCPHDPQRVTGIGGDRSTGLVRPVGVMFEGVPEPGDGGTGLPPRLEQSPGTPNLDLAAFPAS